MKGVIYTAVTGGKDRLMSPAHKMAGVSYIAFTDDPALTADGWEVRMLDWRHADPTRTAKRPKLLPHRHLHSFDWSLWVDGNMEITGDLTPMIEAHLDLAPFVAFRQFQRTCAYQVADACVQLKKDDPAVLRAQAQRYRKLGMPEGLPVAACCTMLRRHHDPGVIEAMELWWREVKRQSRRDQMSLPFVLWSLNTEFAFFFDGGQPYWNELPFLPRRPHLIRESHPWAPVGAEPRSC